MHRQTTPESKEMISLMYLQSLPVFRATELRLLLQFSTAGKEAPAARVNFGDDQTR